MTGRSRTKPVRFDEALAHAIGVVSRNRAALGDSPVLIRDLYGRIRIALREEEIPEDRRKKIERLRPRLHTALGGFSPGEGSLFLFRSDVFDAASIFAADDLRPLGEAGPGVMLLDRHGDGTDWMRSPIEPATETRVPRVTLFGIKGGVGRSTALAVWAWTLAGRHGKRVLIVDLDLESPGVSHSLLGVADRPDAGVADYLVEDAVGQADDDLLRDMIGVSPLSRGLGGVIHVVPAGGGNDRDYLSKLSRAYLGFPREGKRLDFGGRVAEMVRRLEAATGAEIVLIDSRAGLHDIAAVTVTRLQATALLFAIDTHQTWSSYGVLFNHWRLYPELGRSVRQRLQMVAGMVPETLRPEYLARFRENAYELFANNLYDTEGEGTGAAEDELDGFNYGLTDDAAPHSPLPIYWRREFQDFDPVERPAAVPLDHMAAHYGEFMKQANRLVFDGGLE